MIKFRYSHSWIFEYKYFLQFDFFAAVTMFTMVYVYIDNVENLEVDLREMGSFYIGK
jgi:hypothetical protein